MDLLTGYISDGSEPEEEDTVPPKLAARARDIVAQPPQQIITVEHPKGSLSGSRDVAIPSSLPLPTTLASAASEPGPAPGGLASLPTPSAASSAGGRRIVTLQLPLRKEILDATLDSDEEDEPAAKRQRAGGGGGRSRLMDFLPPPKNDLGFPRPKAIPRPVPGPEPVGPSGPSTTAALPAGFFTPGVGGEGGDTEPGGNEAYRVQPTGAASAPGFAHTTPGGWREHEYHQGHGQGYGHEQSAGGPAAAAQPWQQPGATGPPASAPAPSDPLDEALRAEAGRAARRGGNGAGGVRLVEIDAGELRRMDPAAREAANSAREALGADYALSLRRSAGSFEGGKLARRKHQIGTLLHNAKMAELDALEKRAQGHKSKAETAAKYGW